MSRADRLVPVEMLGVGSSCTATVGQRIDYSPNDADREWVARQLGEVEPVARSERPKYSFRPATSAAAVDALMFGTGIVKVLDDGTILPVDMRPDYFGETVPVESLGRDHE